MKKAMFLAAVVLFGTGPVTAQKTPDFAVGPQYDTTHVYVPQDQYDAFMRSFVATFGGSLSKQGEFQVTPTPSKTKSQLALTPAGSISAFGFLTPIPYPFGQERTGYLVTDMDKAVAAAVASTCSFTGTPPSLITRRWPPCRRTGSI